MRLCILWCYTVCSDAFYVFLLWLWTIGTGEKNLDKFHVLIKWSQGKRTATILWASSLHQVVTHSSSVNEEAIHHPNFLYMRQIMMTNVSYQFPVFHHKMLQETGCDTQTAAETNHLDRGFIYKCWNDAKCVKISEEMAWHLKCSNCSEIVLTFTE